MERLDTKWAGMVKWELDNCLELDILLKAGADNVGVVKDSGSVGVLDHGRRGIEIQRDAVQDPVADAVEVFRDGIRLTFHRGDGVQPKTTFGRAGDGSERAWGGMRG